jgi:hypothetical protein
MFAEELNVVQFILYQIYNITDQEATLLSENTTSP